MTATVDDLFCGAGGSSLGAEHAGVRLRLGLNHWDRAIETHATNFQHADHDCADVSALTTNQIRRYITGSDLLLASPECVNHSLAKGARRRKPQAASLFDDGPAGDAEQDRSRATMWDVVRFAEQALLKGRPYKAIVVENVVDAFKWGADDDGALFSAWLFALRALGYEHELMWLNSMFCPPSPAPVPQSRDRMYVVCWRKGIRAPNLRVEPPAWCPQCERVVAGRQTWKRPGRRVWGRYGAQYFYTCPDCHGSVLPGAFPAAAIIDYRLPATKIGERGRPLAQNTRERIRRGLERLAREPFAIRLTHGGAPRPLTLPLVTLTCRHDAAMVLPVAANTFERTSGNRARDAQLVPLDTVHTTHDRAMVIPPMGGVAPRLAEVDPAPTQTTTTRAAIVMRTGHRSANGHVTRVAGTEPGLTLTTHAEQAVVIASRAHAVAKHAGEAPVQTACSGGHLAVVMRNNASRGDQGAMCTPDREPIRTLTGRGHQSLVMANTQNGVPRPAGRAPSQTLRTEGGLAVVVPYTRTGEPLWAGERPMPTLTTRDRAALVWTDRDIDDCLFRMFALHEIAGAMAMRHHLDGSDYVVLGNKRERMKLMGNAVTPPAMALIVGRLLEVIG